MFKKLKRKKNKEETKQILKNRYIDLKLAILIIVLNVNKLLHLREKYQARFKKKKPSNLLKRCTLNKINPKANSKRMMKNFPYKHWLNES